MTRSGSRTIGTDHPVRIALIGNIANNFYREALALSRGQSIEAVCFVEKVRSGPNTEQPLSDPQAKTERTTNFVRYVKPMLGVPWYLLFLPMLLIRRLRNFDQVMFSEIEEMDLRVFSGAYIMLAPKFRGEYVIRPTGGDLTMYPALAFDEYMNLHSGHRPSIRARVSWAVQRLLYRRGYEGATLVAVSKERPYMHALETLRIPRDRVVDGIPLAIDTHAFKRLSKRSSLLPDHVRDDDFLVFMPSRVMISGSPIHRKTGQWKASEVGIEGFHRFLSGLKMSDRERAWLLIPDRTLSKEIDRAKFIVKSLGMEENTVWLRGTDEQGLTRSEMVPLYSTAAATLDDFGVGWYGSVVVEAAACESPVVTYVTDEVLASTGNPPFLIAKTPEEVALHLKILHKDPEAARQIGRASREWVRDFHSDRAVGLAYQRVLNRAGFPIATGGTLD